MEESLVPKSRRRRRLPPTEKEEDWSVAQLIEHGLAVRTVNSLESENIIMVSQLLKMKGEDLLGIKNLGVTAFKELVATVARAELPVPAEWKVTSKK